MTENEYMELLWGMEDAIENLKIIKKMLTEMARKVNLDGKAESDMKEIAFDFDRAINALKEIQEYRALGTVEELSTSVKEKDVLKFYYCEVEDDYYIGQGIDATYYAKYGKTGFTSFMSRHPPWGKHIVDRSTEWKELTFPSEPKEIPFFKWLVGFVKTYCGGTVEELREAADKQKAKKPHPYIAFDKIERNGCPNCFENNGRNEILYAGQKYCSVCGQRIDWSQDSE